jgi:DNA polymerase-1
MAQKMGDVEKGSPEYELLTALMTMKSINTKRGLYYEPYPAAVHWKDGRLHPELIQCSTNTRRWSARKVNIQQLDSDYNGIRSVILPHRRDAVVVSLDQSAQEIRLTADYSRDNAMMTCFVGSKEELRDVHSIVGCEILKRPYEDLRGKEDKVRSTAKLTLFAMIYGGAAPKIAENLGISTEEAQKYIDTIYSKFSSLAKWKQGVEQFAERFGYVNVLGGTRRHLRKNLLSDNSYEQSKALRQASNAMIQSAGANQIKMVMSLLWDSDLFEKYDVQWMFPIHDECCFSVRKEHAVQVIQEVHRMMLTPFLKVIPAASSIGLGRTFGTLVELGEVFDAGKVEEALHTMFNEDACLIPSC